MKSITLIIAALLINSFAFAEISSETSNDMIVTEAQSVTESLTPNQLKKLLGNYPTLGSAESDKDLETLLWYQNNRTEEDCQRARLEMKASFENFYVNNGNILSKEEGKKLKLLFILPLIKGAINITLAKEMYKRPRPYLTWTELKPCVSTEKSKAYPSGHATLAYLYGEVLKSLYPERSAAIDARADEIALNRVIGGVHHPSDIAAGKTLGKRLAGKMLTEAWFQKELNQIRE